VQRERRAAKRENGAAKRAACKESGVQRERRAKRAAFKERCVKRARAKRGETGVLQRGVQRAAFKVCKENGV
jgi:hypothetical protein